MKTFILFGKRDQDRAAATNLLEKIYVAAPCPASWEKMIGDDRVRHCQECKLNVYNLSEMARTEAERLIASREGRMCVGFYRRADGTILTQDCPRGLQATLRRVSRLAGAALSAMMSLGTGFAQASSQPSTPSQSDRNAKLSSQLTLDVVDFKGKAIPGAEIYVVDKNGKKTFLVTDAAGLASLSDLPSGTVAIRVVHWRYKRYSKEIAIAEGTTETRRITLEFNGAVVQIRGFMMFKSDLDESGDPVQLTGPGIQGKIQSGSQAATESNQELGGLDVIVTDPTGAIAPNAQVTLTAPNGKQTKLFTDSTGKGRFSGLAAGNYTVVVALRGFRENYRKVDVQKGTPTTMSVVLSVQDFMNGGPIGPEVVLIPTLDPSPDLHLDPYKVLPVRTHKQRH